MVVKIVSMANIIMEAQSPMVAATRGIIAPCCPFFFLQWISAYSSQHSFLHSCIKVFKIVSRKIISIFHQLPKQNKPTPAWLSLQNPQNSAPRRTLSVAAFGPPDSLARSGLLTTDWKVSSSVQPYDPTCKQRQGWDPLAQHTQSSESSKNINKKVPTRS